MIEWNGKRYWIVGASAGLGKALAEVMSRAGVTLVLSARDAEALRELSDGLPGKSEILPLDVSDPASLDAACQNAGAVDGLVYLAGVYWPMRAEEWDCDKAEAMADINFTGLVRTVGRVLPGMIARDAGHIVIAGSLSAYRGLPSSIGYTASKAGVVSLAECLHADLRGSNVRVQLVNPGFVRSRLTDKNRFNMPFLMEPEDAARAIFEHMNASAFKTAFPLRLAWPIRLTQFLPDSLYYRLFS